MNKTVIMESLTHSAITLGQTGTSLLYLVVAWQIFQRHRYSLEPVHIYQLNTIVTCAIFAPVHIGSRYLANWGSLCRVIEWLRYYNWHDFITGLLLTQTDRFLALFWHAEYKERLSPELATKTVVVSKLILLLPISVAAAVCPATLQCVESPVLECAILPKLEQTLLLMDIPVVAAFTAVVAVSLYVGRVRRRLKETLQPPVNLPTVHTIHVTPCRNEIKVLDIESEEHTETEEQTGQTDGVTEPRNQSDAKRLVRIRESSGGLPASCLVSTLVISQQAKDTIRMNLLTLTLIMIFLTRGFLNLYFYISQAECDDQTILLYRLNSFPQLVLVVSYPLMIKIKLNK